MQKVSVKKDFIGDFLKSALLSIIIGTLLILLFAVILNFFPLQDKIVTAINEGINLIAVFVGCLFAFKEKKNGLLKGLLSGLIYGLGMALIFAIINKNFSFSWGTMLDVGLCAVLGALSGILSINIGRKK